jgi:hypothetical protein
VAAIKREDVPVAIETEDAEVRMSDIGEMTVAFFRLKKGADFGPALAGLPGDMCQCPHWGYLLKGRIKMKTVSGDQHVVWGRHVDIRDHSRTSGPPRSWGTRRSR